MGVLCDREILRELGEDGRIIIDPFDQRNLGPNSYDVRLGEYFYRQYLAHTDLSFIDPWDEEQSSKLWYGPGRVRSNDDSPYIVVYPGETILSHTEEFIGSRHGVVSSMRARSSIARLGLSVCKCAGLGDMGYIWRWTMEISNHGKIPIALRPGMRVAQILFQQSSEPGVAYEGKYGQGRKFEDWQPEDMLPKLYQDWEVRPSSPGESSSPLSQWRSPF